MKAILTVIGKDKVGIIAGISTELQKFEINIVDVNQTIMEEYFTMIMMLDLGKVNTNFEDAKAALVLKGIELGVDVKIQRSEIFNVMHTL
ncbi:MAG: ACT domain-containing protein [Clostridium sp.]